MTIGDRIRKALERANKSQAELARALSVSRSAVGQWLSDDSVPTGPNLVGVARFLGVTPTWLATGAGDMGLSGVAEDTAGYEASPRLVEVKALDARAAGGGGAIVDSEEVIGVFGFPPGEFSTPAAQLRIVTVIGDSMLKPGDSSSLHSGDRVVVDIGQKSPSPPGIFVLYDGIGTIVKRVEIVPGKKRIRVFSINPAYSDTELAASEVHIQGRVVGVWRKM